eukprot:jgi/Tetstr1/434094/TSEL_023238.t1
MSSVPWTSLLATAGAGTLLGYALATTQWRGAATSTSSLSRQAALEQEDDSGEDDEEYEDCKMVLVVRQDLKMGKGKIAAQCCHAAVGVVMDLCEEPAGYSLMMQWEANGATKVAVKAETEAVLLDVERRCGEAGIPSFMVIDAGRTQIAPNSRTVLAVGPAPTALVDSVTGDLKLL